MRQGWCNERGRETWQPDGLGIPALERFFAGHVPGYTGTLGAKLLPSGRSNLT